MTEQVVDPDEVPAGLVAGLQDLDESELRAVIDYARARIDQLHPTVTDRIEEGPGEELLSVEDRGAYTEVVKRQPCPAGCSDCPHGPYLYHVTEERRSDGTTHLHWSYVGRNFE